MARPGVESVEPPEQVGYRRRMRAELRGMARQEFAEDAETCFRVSGEPYFEMEAVEKRLAELMKERESAGAGG